MLKIVFTSEDNENSMFGIEEFPISAEHASQLMRGNMCIERFSLTHCLFLYVEPQLL